MCDINHHIIGIHFFENHLNGIFPDSFINLKWMKHLNIFNDGREYENSIIYHRNTFYAFDSEIVSKLTELEEINMQHLDMYGFITENFVRSLKKLKYINLAHNRLTK